MERIKVDVLVLGDLICKEKLTGGGKLYPCRREEVEEFFDIDGACIVRGDVEASCFDSGEKVVAVCGSVAAKGGGHGEL